VLARNRSLGRLEELRLWPRLVGRLADPLIDRYGMYALAQSRNLLRLKRLTLQRSTMGDEGVSDIVREGLLRRAGELRPSAGRPRAGAVPGPGSPPGPRPVAEPPDPGRLPRPEA